MVGTTANVIAYIMSATSIRRNRIRVHYPAHYIEGVYILPGNYITREFPCIHSCSRLFGMKPGRTFDGNGIYSAVN